MGFLTNRLNELVTHFARGTTISAFGDYTHDDPVEINGRWEQRAELFIGSDGNEQRSNAVVYLDTDVAIGDFLLLGEASSSTANPEDEENARQVLAFQKIPGMLGNDSQRKAFL